MQSGGLDAVGDKARHEIRAFAYADDADPDDLCGDRKISFGRDMTIDDGCTLRSAYSAKEEGSVYFSVCGGLSRSSSDYIGVDDEPAQRQDPAKIFNDRRVVEESITTLFPEDAFTDDETCANSVEEEENIEATEGDKVEEENIEATEGDKVEEENIEATEEDKVEEGNWEQDRPNQGEVAVEMNDNKEILEEDLGGKEKDVAPHVNMHRQEKPVHDKPLSEEDPLQHQQDISQQNASEGVRKNSCREAETVGPIFSLPCEDLGQNQESRVPCQECLVRERDVEMYQKTIRSLRSTIESMSHDAQDQIQSLEEEIRMLRVQHTEQVSSLLRENSSMWKELRRVKEREQKHVLLLRDEEKSITSYTGKTKQKSKPKIVIPMAASMSQDMTSPPGYSPLAAGRLMHYNSTP